MRSSWHPSREELMAYSREHLYYEVERTVALPGLILARGSSPPGRDRVEHDSLLESFLVHIRLLDDFLGDPRQTKGERVDADDVFARHWLPSWTPQRFMTADERDRANAQIVHLTGRRIMGYGWYAPDLACRCCEAFEGFCAAVEQEDAELAEALTPTRTQCRRFLSVLSTGAVPVPT